MNYLRWENIISWEKPYLYARELQDKVDGNGDKAIMFGMTMCNVGKW